MATRKQGIRCQTTPVPWPHGDIYKIGDLVRLKSGDPMMTVEEIAGTSVTCVLFHNEEKAKYHTFKAAIVGAAQVS